nr:aminopeptidase N [Acidimicrobiia bacterium]
MAIRTNLTRSDAYERSMVVHSVSYSVHLDLTGGDETFESTSTVTFGASPGAETFLDVGARAITSVTLNGEALPAAASSNVGRIELAGLKDHNTVVVQMTAEFQHTGVGLHHFRDPVDGRADLHTQFLSLI